ncbi:MAG: hypothetical protein JTJ26_11865, partial [Prevotella sp.]|nr:hypothetical protein [Prevotella sp.]
YFLSFLLKNPVLFAKCVIGCKSTKNNSKSHTFFIFFLLILWMERRVLSWAEGVMGDGMEGVGRYGRDGWNGWNGWNSVQRYNFSLILPNLGV